MRTRSGPGMEIWSAYKMPAGQFNRLRRTITVTDFETCSPEVRLHVHARYNCGLCDLAYGWDLNRNEGARYLLNLHFPVRPFPGSSVETK